MDILGIGPLELFFIVMIALIVLGPKDMVKAGRTIGKNLRKLVTSENWRTIQQASNEIRTLPNRLIREAGLDEVQKEIKSTADDLNTSIPKDLIHPNIKPPQFNYDEWTKTPSNTEIQEQAVAEVPQESHPAETVDNTEQS
jgi:Sec-independent protein translocase protein TatA